MKIRRFENFITSILFELHWENNDGDEGENKVKDTDANVDEMPKLGHDALDELKDARKDEKKIESSIDNNGKHFKNAGSVYHAAIVLVNLEGSKRNGRKEHKEEGDDFNLSK